MVRTAPLTPTRLKALTVVVGVAALAVGALVGQGTRRFALFSLRDVTWGTDAVSVSYTDGSTPLSLAVLAALLALLGAACWWGGRFVAAHAVGTDAEPRWRPVAGAVWVVAVVGSAIGWATTTADDGILATRVADFLRDEGGDVDAEITAGESEVVRPGGSGGTTLTAPLVLAFTVDGTACTLVLDDPLLGDGGTLALTPSC